VDRRHIELQIRIVLVTFRIEQRRRDISTMKAFRDRARSILDALADDVRPYPDLEAQLQEAREELAGARSATGARPPGDEQVR
jgi:hypothetical protein